MEGKIIIKMKEGRKNWQKKRGKAETLLLQHQRGKENKKLTKGKERASDGKKITQNRRENTGKKGMKRTINGYCRSREGMGGGVAVTNHCLDGRRVIKVGFSAGQCVQILQIAYIYIYRYWVFYCSNSISNQTTNPRFQYLTIH